MDIPKFVSTSDVPHQFLKATFLTGSIPFKAVKTEPRISYTVYVPHEYLNPDPSLRYSKDSKDLSPAYKLPLLPLIVNIHGTSRNAGLCRDRLISFANAAQVAVLAPLFPAGIDSYNDLDNYKLLRYKSLHCDRALLEILDEVKVRWPGIITEKIFLMGFSGGGQFAQRFLYLYPERLHAVSIGAPGGVTMLDDELKWPAGIKDVSEVFNGAFIDKSKVREVDIQLIAGGADSEVHGGTEFWAWLAKKRQEFSEGSEKGTAKEPRKGGEPMGSRVATLEKLKSHWDTNGIRSQLDIVEGVKHDSDGVLSTVIDFLRPLLSKAN